MPYSDHVPVSIAFDLDIDHAALSEWNHSVRATWCKATSKNVTKYKTDLENKLYNLQYIKDIFYVMCFVLITKMTFVSYIMLYSV